MGVFNLAGLNPNQSKSVVADSLALMMYSYHNIDDGFSVGYGANGFGTGLPLTLLTALFGNDKSQGIFAGIPWNPDSEKAALEEVNRAGWYVIDAETLGYEGITDHRGTYYGEQNGYGSAQAEVLGKYDDNGKLIEIGIAFRGTSGPRESIIIDTLGDLALDLLAAFGSEDYCDNFTLNAFGNLLSNVAKFASQHGLTGDNVVISGHSLGGLAVNSTAALSDSQWNGFFSNSHYVAYASPSQYEEGGKVLNIGFENDPVYRALNGDDFELSSLFVHDAAHESTTDNIVNFNDYHASGLWNALPFSILNIPSWISHLPFFYQDIMARILTSDFYNCTNRDSTIIVSSLSDATRGSTWVEDLNRYAEKHTGPTFYHRQ